MGKLITLDAYFNQIGRELYPDDWTDETVYYYSERKKDLMHLRERALKTYKKAINQIWKDGKIKISYRIEQGYFDPTFAINDLYFAESICFDKNGNDYACVVELFEKENRGAPRKFDYILPMIKQYVEENHYSIGIPTSDISADAVISYIDECHLKLKKKGPVGSTIRNYLHKAHPECKKTSKNSNK